MSPYLPNVNLKHLKSFLEAIPPGWSLSMLSRHVILVLSPQYVCGWCMFLTVKWIFVDSLTFSSPWEGSDLFGRERDSSVERERGGDKKFD